MKTPAHFKGRPLTWKIYVMDCAIRDRETYLSSISEANGEEKNREESKAELKAMRAESNRLRRELSRRQAQAG